jgi:hypothetical protein
VFSSEPCSQTQCMFFPLRRLAVLNVNVITGYVVTKLIQTEMFCYNFEMFIQLWVFEKVRMWKEADLSLRGLMKVTKPQ